ncbi:hypothetical protein HK100_004173 [Physocladia obscura]|uniref:VASt domain-containing protein n=1 Tax=Physocladia obscura TaxID=109957 RepID=A0AAD5XKR6_9FUNG|nr:hypothetical protein HK100_004173 [Physocladia obscura]
MQGTEAVSVDSEVEEQHAHPEQQSKENIFNGEFEPSTGLETDSESASESALEPSAKSRQSIDSCAETSSKPFAAIAIRASSPATGSSPVKSVGAAFFVPPKASTPLVISSENVSVFSSSPKTSAITQRTSTPPLLQSKNLVNGSSRSNSITLPTTALLDSEQKNGSLHSHSQGQARFRSSIDAGEDPSLRSADAVAVLKLQRNNSRSQKSAAGNGSNSDSTIAVADSSRDASINGNGNGGNVINESKVSKKRNLEFHDLFPAIESSENLVEDYSCAWQRDILVQGKMYLTAHHMCFHANIFGWSHHLILDFDDVISIEKKSIGGFIPNSIEFCTIVGQKHYFASFLARDTSYDIITKLWGNTSKAIKMKTFKRTKSLIPDPEQDEQDAAEDNNDDLPFEIQSLKTAAKSNNESNNSTLDTIGQLALNIIRGRGATGGNGGVNGSTADTGFGSRSQSPGSIDEYNTVLGILDRRLSVASVQHVKGLAELAVDRSVPGSPITSAGVLAPGSEEGTIIANSKNIHVVHQKHVVVLPPSESLSEPLSVDPPILSSPPNSPDGSIIDLTPHLKKMELRKAASMELHKVALLVDRPASSLSDIAKKSNRIASLEDSSKLLSLPPPTQSTTSVSPISMKKLEEISAPASNILPVKLPAAESSLSLLQRPTEPPPAVTTAEDVDSVVWKGDVKSTKAISKRAKDIESKHDENSGDSNTSDGENSNLSLGQNPVAAIISDGLTNSKNTQGSINHLPPLPNPTSPSFVGKLLGSKSRKPSINVIPVISKEQTSVIPSLKGPTEIESASTLPSSAIIPEPVKCTCGAIHAKMTPILTTTILFATPPSIWTLLYSTSKETVKYLTQYRNVTSGIKTTSWHSASDAFPKFTPDIIPDQSQYEEATTATPYPFINVLQGHSRRGEYVTPLTNPLGPKSTRCFIEDSVIACSDACLCVMQSTVTPDVPSGTSFITRTRICWRLKDSGSVELEVSCETEFVKSSWIQGIIQAAVIDGMKTFYRDLEVFICDALKATTSLQQKHESHLKNITKQQQSSKLLPLLLPLSASSKSQISSTLLNGSPTQDQQQQQHPLEDELELLQLQSQESRKKFMISLIPLEMMNSGSKRLASQPRTKFLPPRRNSSLERLRLRNHVKFGSREFWDACAAVWNGFFGVGFLGWIFGGLVLLGGQIFAVWIVQTLFLKDSSANGSSKKGVGFDDEDAVKKFVSTLVDEALRARGVFEGRENVLWTDGSAIFDSINTPMVTHPPSK